MLLQNLKSQLRKQVIVSIPATMEDVIKNATFLENTSTVKSTAKVKAWQQHKDSAPPDPMERLADAMKKMSLGLTTGIQNLARPASEPVALLYCKQFSVALQLSIMIVSSQWQWCRNLECWKRWISV